MTLCLVAKLAISHIRELSKYCHYDHVIVYYGMAKVLNPLLKNHLITTCLKWSATYVERGPFHYLQVNVISNKSLNTSWTEAYTNHWLKILTFSLHSWRIKPTERHIVSFKYNLSYRLTVDSVLLLVTLLCSWIKSA